MRVLVVEDDQSLASLLKKGLEIQGHVVHWVADGESALTELSRSMPDLMVLDLCLPKRDGMEVLAEMKAFPQVPRVLVLTGRSDVQARVQCLDLGADDCLVKPFSFMELSARCRALLRRRSQIADQVIRHGNLELSRIEHTVRCAGRPVELTVKEFGLLEYLMLHAGECVSREQLLSEVWKLYETTGTNIVDVYVNYLRRKLGASSGLIETVRGVGYRIRTGSHSLHKTEHIPFGEPVLMASA